MDNKKDTRQDPINVDNRMSKNAQDIRISENRRHDSCVMLDSVTTSKKTTLAEYWIWYSINHFNIRSYLNEFDIDESPYKITMFYCMKLGF